MASGSLWSWRSLAESHLCVHGPCVHVEGGVELCLGRVLSESLGVGIAGALLGILGVWLQRPKDEEKLAFSSPC